MSYNLSIMSGSSAASAYHYATLNAIKACGSIINVDPDIFLQIANKIENPVIVKSTGGYFSKHNVYLTTYKGLTFYCKSKTELILPSKSELIAAKKIVIPDL